MAKKKTTSKIDKKPTDFERGTPASYFFKDWAGKTRRVSGEIVDVATVFNELSDSQQEKVRSTGTPYVLALYRNSNYSGSGRTFSVPDSWSDVYSFSDKEGDKIKYEEYAEGGEITDGYIDLSHVKPSKIQVSETTAFGNPDKLILNYDGKKIGQFYFNMRGYNQDFSMKNKDGVHAGFGGDKSKSKQLSDFKSYLKDGFTLVKLDKKFEKGGTIPNNYEGKTAEQVWNAWSFDQRDHFIADHLKQMRYFDPKVDLELFKEPQKLDFNELPESFKWALKSHVSHGQYARGGKITASDAKRQVERFFNLWDKSRSKIHGHSNELGTGVSDSLKNGWAFSDSTNKKLVDYINNNLYGKISNEEYNTLKSLADSNENRDSFIKKYQGRVLTDKHLPQLWQDFLEVTYYQAMLRQYRDMIDTMDVKSAWAEGGEIKTITNSEEYYQVNDQYDLTGALLDDETNEDKKNELRKKLKELELVIHRYERNYAEGGKIGDWTYFKKLDEKPFASRAEANKRIKELKKENPRGMYQTHKASGEYPILYGVTDFFEEDWRKYVAVSETKDGYWVIISIPSTKEKAQNMVDTYTAPKGEVGKVVTIEEARAHKKVLGREYLDKDGSFAKGGSIDKFNLVYEVWSKMMGGNGVSGTIRTRPENYYVATIDDSGNISFSGIESMTRDIDISKVKEAWENKQIPVLDEGRGNKGFVYAQGGAVDYSFEYQMLSRLQSDCEYYLGFGGRSEKVLWAGDVDGHIEEMKRLWNKLPEKPEWLSMEEILDYENKIKGSFAKGGITETWDSYKVKKSKYETGDKVYSWQNKSYPAEVVRKRFSPWESVSKPHENDTWQYLVRLEDGERSKWMPEASMFESEQKEYGKGGSITNQYEGKSGEQIWKLWSEIQKVHFLQDHIRGIGNENVQKYSTSSFDKLPKDVQAEVGVHVHFGQYAEGGNIATSGSGYAIKVKSKGNRIYVAFTGSNKKDGTSFFATKEEAEEFIKDKLPQKSLDAKVVPFPTNGQHAEGGKVGNGLTKDDGKNVVILEKSPNEFIIVGAVSLNPINDKSFEDYTKAFYHARENKLFVFPFVYTSDVMKSIVLREGIVYAVSNYTSGDNIIVQEKELRDVWILTSKATDYLSYKGLDSLEDDSPLAALIESEGFGAMYYASLGSDSYDKDFKKLVKTLVQDAPSKFKQAYKIAIDGMNKILKLLDLKLGESAYDKKERGGTLTVSKPKYKKGKSFELRDETVTIKNVFPAGHKYATSYSPFYHIASSDSGEDTVSEESMDAIIAGHRMALGGEVIDKESIYYHILNHCSSGFVSSVTGITKYKDVDGVKAQALANLRRDGQMNKPYSMGALVELLQEAKDDYFENEYESQFKHKEGGEVGKWDGRGFSGYEKGDRITSKNFHDLKTGDIFLGESVSMHFRNAMKVVRDTKTGRTNKSTPYPHETKLIDYVYVDKKGNDREMSLWGSEFDTGSYGRQKYYFAKAVKKEQGGGISGDESNDSILKTRMDAYNAIEGIRNGDYLKLPNGSYDRFTSERGDIVQLGGNNGSYYLSPVNITYSGGLTPSIDKKYLTPTEETKEGNVWFFKDDWYKAHNGITYSVPFRVFVLSDDAPEHIKERFSK